MEIYWIWLTQLKGLGLRYQRKLLDYFGNPKDIYEADRSELLASKTVTELRADVLTQNKSLDCAEIILRECERHRIKIAHINDGIFPERLLRSPDLPTLIYYKGELKSYANGVGIVGARRCSREGRDKCIEVATEAAAQGKAVISGMALGIDGYAHTAALKNDGYTIAVLGCGPDICFPPAHKGLKVALERNGAVLSELPPGLSAREFNFPRRNRIIAALSDELYVIDAKPGSGSLITAGYAEKYNIPVNKFLVREA